MKRLDSFLKRLFRNQHSSQEYLSQLQEMLYEKVDDLVEKGYSEKEAIEKTIDEFSEEQHYYFSNIEDRRKDQLRRRTLWYYRNHLIFSLISTFTLIVIYFIVNFNWLFTPSAPWLAIVLALGTLQWPLKIFFMFLNKKGE